MNSEFSSDVALAAAAVAITLTVVLFLYAVGLRIAHTLHDKDLERVKDRWWPIIAQATMDENHNEAAGLATLRRGSRVKLLREWCRFRRLVRGSSSHSLEILANEMGLLRTARRLLRRRSVSSKLLAVQALGFLCDEDSWSQIEALLDHRNITISITAASALVHIDAVKGVNLILPLIGKRAAWPRTQVGRILNFAGQDAVTGPFCRTVELSGTEETCRLLQFYESVSVAECDSLIAKLLATRSNPTLIATALKAVRGQLPRKMIERLVTHKAWFVRMQAASLLGRFGRREDYPILEPLLSDSEWWVRYRAAQAITKLPFLGPKALRKLRDRQRDKFARDILQQSFAETGLA